MTPQKRCSGGGQGHGDHQSTLWPVCQTDVAAVAARDCSRNGETKASATGLSVARSLHSEEGLEHLFMEFGGDARSLIGDGEDDTLGP